MAITDIRQYVHLTAADIEELGRELDAIRTDIEESRGERDARYVRRTIQLQRALVVGGLPSTEQEDTASPSVQSKHSDNFLRHEYPNIVGLKFRIREGVRESFGVDPGTGRRRGLRTALRELQTGEVAAA